MEPAQTPGEKLDRAPRVFVAMPAYNAARTLASTWSAIPADLVTEVLLVDDASSDNTLAVAARLPIETIALPHNVGYGGNQKTCYLEAIRKDADVVVMLHPDGQYDPRLLGDIIKPIVDGEADIVLGSRMMIKGGARAGNMPLYRYVSNKFLTFVENLLMGRKFSELHTGYRAYSGDFLRTIPFMRNSNDFVFDTQVIVQAVAFNQRITEIPITTRYHAEASSTSMSANIKYALETLYWATRYRLFKLKLIPSKLFKS